MDRIFRIDFYPQDWLVKTGGLTAEETGLYIQIVALIYSHRGPIDYDLEEISRKVKKCSTRMAKSIIDRLVAKEKIYVRDGKIGQRRAELELNRKRTHLEDSAKGGRTKAEKMADSKKNKGLSSSGGTNSLPSPSPSPSPSPYSTDSNESVAQPGSAVEKTVSPVELGMAFNALWHAYPSRGRDGATGQGFKGSRKKAAEKFSTLYRNTKEPERENFIRNLCVACEHYTEFLDRSGYPSQHLTTWLNQAGWETDYSGTTTGTQRRSGSGYSLDDVAAKVVADRTNDPEGRKERLAALGIEYDNGNP